jgi:hypothetical protein
MAKPCAALDQAANFCAVLCGSVQFRPDGLPIIRTQIFARNFPIGRLFDLSAAANRNRPVASNPLVQCWLGYADRLSQQCLAT